MSDDCSAGNCTTPSSRTYRCPANGREYRSVSVRTVMHHVQQAWRRVQRGGNYYFCEDPDCEVVYFAGDDSVILKSGVRTSIGVKIDSADAPICYCFGVTKADALANPGIKRFVMEQTKHGVCSCETSNPSGRCCLKNFPGPVLPE
ncbi:MAG: hypothetical protein WBM97_21655 [Sedimenticolaceae bacterium]